MAVMPKYNPENYLHKNWNQCRKNLRLIQRIIRLAAWRFEYRILPSGISRALSNISHGGFWENR